MQRITRIEWDRENEQHIARHGVTSEEVEEVCFSHPLVRKSRQGTRLAYGQTVAGRYLLVVLRVKSEGMVRCITARPMTTKEKRYYRQRRPGK